MAANQNILQLTQQTGSADTTSVLYAVKGGNTDTGLPLTVLFNSPTLTGTPNIAGYLTSALAASTYLTPAAANLVYLTTSSAAATYLTQSAATSTYATITNLALKAPLASPIFTGTVTIPTIAASAGTINGTSVGATTASTGKFTTVQATSHARLLYTKSSAQSLTATPATITGWTQVFDANANFNATTGIFTAPNTGFYQVSGQIDVLLSSPPVGSQTQVVVVVNGTNLLQAVHIAGATTEGASVLPFSGLVSLTAGQTLSITGYSSTTFSTAANAQVNWLSIAQVP